MIDGLGGAVLDGHQLLPRGRVAAWCVLLAVMLVPLSWAQDVTDFEFDHITYRQGLVSSSVSAITQDRFGFLWFASQSGLHRYDGYSMRVYGAEPFNANSLSNQLVQSIFLAEEDVMWVGTYSGLNRFHITSETFRSFPHDPDNPTTLSNNVVVAVAKDASGALWVGTLKGLNRLEDEDAGRFTQFLPNAEQADALPHETVRSLFLDSSGRMWVGTYGGIAEILSAPDGTTQFRKVADPNGGAARNLPSDFVMAITEDAAGFLWIGMWGGGVSRFDPRTETFEHYTLPDQRVYSLLVAEDQMVYAGTWGGGLHILNPRNATIASYRHDPALPFGLAHDVVYSLYEDNSGIIWIGTNGNGINKLDRDRRSFRYLHPELPAERRLSTGKVHAVYRHAADGNLYVGFQTAGMNVVDGATGAVTRYRHSASDPASITSDTVNTIFGESQETLLIGTHAGVNRFFVREGRFERVFASSDPQRGITDDIIYQIVPAADGTLWFGTYNSGVFRRNTDGSFTQFANDPANDRSIVDNLIYNIHRDSAGVMWVATNGGLNRFDAQRGDFDRFVYDPSNPSGLSGRNTGNVFEDSRGTLWVGTRSGGLNRFNRETETFTHITSADGMSGNAVVNILESPSGELYVATANGLNVVNPRTGAVATIDERDGLRTREFSTGAWREANGDLLFGAFSEIVRVRSHATTMTSQPPTPAITAIRVNNQPWPADRVAHTLERIELDYTQNFLSISFSALSYALPSRNQYRYRLVGIDADWTDAYTRNSADYTNLPPGNYRFEVHAADARGAWSLEPAVLTVRIAPPFWQTPWFTGSVIALIAAAVWLAYYLRVREFHRRNRILEETVAARTLALKESNEQLSEANALKDRFFSIVAHDLRGPVAGMASLTEEVVRSFESFPPNEVREIFETMRTTSRGLAGMLENLLEWARLQTGKIDYHPRNLAPVTVATHLVEAFSSAAHSKNISLTVRCTDAVRCYGDEYMTRAIVENLISNAVKFTPHGGKVDIECGAEHMVFIRVRDTGVGIPAEKIGSLFDVDNRLRSVGTAGERGSGFGLALCKELAERQGGSVQVESRVDQGTTVTVWLPAARREGA